ncbi:hypothetical protein TraAM80_01150 [Trypanosoma rangeli]|uniref:Ribosomal protein L7Ae/L30e/S12e/Gadd45 domain-containing protein n=1 Tax=Trypanosoma rangeli TaxID=5698 RepID=A0A3R7LBH7_TRYRA|nr:uncharacterized protein TraAM80_01150 [Trypanosoma rangeli]RNF11023.1 hypothetical protein TraAM80_01150 [Trypanosoma rangeli]|eukprot:RNF11023.1 hypothetical protein TraAM80_01150 [Trypanosoma rangeli]
MPNTCSKEAQEHATVEPTPRRGDRRRRHGMMERTAVYMSDFLPSQSSPLAGLQQPHTHLGQKREERALNVAGSRRTEDPHWETKRRGVLLFPRAATAAPSGARPRKHMEVSQAWALRRKGKRRDPDTPFNHRAQFSKLRRAINAERKAVFESMLSCSDGAQPLEPLVSLNSKKTEPEDCGGNVPEASVETPAHASPQQTQLRRMQGLVADMGVIYSQLHRAMRGRNYTEAGRHMRHIRQLKKRLNTAALKWRLNVVALPDAETAASTICPPRHEVESSESVAECCAASNDLQLAGDADGTAELIGEPNYMNFYPSLAQVGVGCHALATWIDRRSHRYPRRVAKEELSRFVDAGPENEQEQASLTGPAVPPTVKFVGLYCTNVITDALDDLVFTILQQQYHLQRRMKKEKPLQFKARRFYTIGLRETLKGLRAAATRIPVVFLASDIEVNAALEMNGPCEAVRGAGAAAHQLPGGKRRTVQEMGVGGTLEEIRSHCVSRDIPLITCMNRRRLAYALFAKGCTISAVLLHSAEGVHEEVRALRHYAQHLFTAFATVAAAHENTPDVL